MRLSEFIQRTLEPILQEWEDFARQIQPAHRSMNVAELRDHAEDMLREIAEDLERPRSDSERMARAKGRAPQQAGDSPAEIHATHRLMCGFTIDQLVAEYRALRASVLRLWAEGSKIVSGTEAEEVARFNEAIDQSLSEAVARYSKMVKQAEDIFIGILGHDIRTPLNAISIGAETLMRTESLDGKTIQIASRIFNSSSRISELVDALLDFTQARFGMQLLLRPANMGLLAEQVVEELRAAYADSTIVLGIAGDLDGAWDSGRVSQVLANLVSNALQHGLRTETVTVALAGDADEVTCTVHNAGTPIPEEEIGHIFEPLRRYSRTPRDDRSFESNLGLGLYIAREVVIAHGGTINVVSNETDGTTFTVRLPKWKA